MNREETLVKYLIASGGFRELDTPVIVTSGEFLTPFFVSAEKLCGDAAVDEALNRFGEDPAAMMRYAADLAGRNASFGEVIDALAAGVSEIFGKAGTGEKRALSGGQRRDWLFSGPAAERLGVPHVSIFKPRDGSQRVLLHGASGAGEILTPDLRGFRVVHVADLITLGSSVYEEDRQTGKRSGWVPVLRGLGAEITDLVTVISRNQGGEALLAEQGVKVHALITVDGDFISRHARNPEALASFLRDPQQWTGDYLEAHGPGLLRDYLEDDAKKLPRLKKFVLRYRQFLDKTDWLTGFLEGGHEQER